MSSLKKELQQLVQDLYDSSSARSLANELKESILKEIRYVASDGRYYLCKQYKTCSPSQNPQLYNKESTAVNLVIEELRKDLDVSLQIQQSFAEVSFSIWIGWQPADSTDLLA